MKIEDTQHWMVIADDAGTDTHFGNEMIALTRKNEIKSVALVRGTTLMGGANNVLLQTTRVNERHERTTVLVVFIINVKITSLLE
jgi:hypothetical protein